MAKINRDLIEPIMIAIFAGILSSIIAQNIGSITATIKPFAEISIYTIDQFASEYANNGSILITFIPFILKRNTPQLAAGCAV